MALVDVNWRRGNILRRRVIRLGRGAMHCEQANRRQRNQEPKKRRLAEQASHKGASAFSSGAVANAEQEAEDLSDFRDG
jgi:hypothetical protein